MARAFSVEELAGAVAAAMGGVVKEMGAQTRELAQALVAKAPPARPSIRPSRAALTDGSTLVVGNPHDDGDLLGGLSDAASSIIEASGVVERAAEDVRRIASVAQKAARAFEFEAQKLDQCHFQLSALAHQMRR